eukprot:TRINITY_DN3100_c0_g1_i3.p3 TRINITY_DN3100_c0_g1~~TRINITY_DN3100_c0_g1_i3.p3  ORF type:complete len:161 (+),score=33.09 TRINITY_DN3100_c0_g1_i3:28-483(+)
MTNPTNIFSILMITLILSNIYVECQTVLPDDGVPTAKQTVIAQTTHYYKITRTSTAYPANLNTEIALYTFKYTAQLGISFSNAKQPVDCTDSLKNDFCVTAGNQYQGTWLTLRANPETDPSLSSEIWIAVRSTQASINMEYNLRAYTVGKS